MSRRASRLLTAEYCALGMVLCVLLAVLVP